MGLFVISVGGSLIVPSEIDCDFLRDFKAFIDRRVDQGDRFILIAGGGKTARKYQDGAAGSSEVDNEDKDWMGIHATRLNAHLLRTIFKEHAEPKIVTHYEPERLDNVVFEKKILVGSGWKPGWSTDYDAVLLGEKFGADFVINLSNVDYVYSEDPRDNPNATKYEQMSWPDFRNIVGDEWDPGKNAPFDPIASKKCDEIGMKVAILNGKNLKNIEAFIDGKKFKGTIIE